MTDKGGHELFRSVIGYYEILQKDSPRGISNRPKYHMTKHPIDWYISNFLIFREPYKEVSQG